MPKSILLLFAIAALHACSSPNITFTPEELPVIIPTKGNTWLLGIDAQTDRSILRNGIKDWNLGGIVSRTYFYISKPGKINIGINSRSTNNAELKVSFKGKSKVINIDNQELELVSVGTYTIEKPGYHFLEITGNSDESATVDIPDVLIGGEATEDKVYYAREDFYWGRRGPSVHLTYQVPDPAQDVVYFYNEINVPEGEDVLGSYFMANGFAEGYFGIQVNGPDERRILFSVWSPFKTDNPQDIPEDQRIKMLKKGDGVYTGEFGNEGSGGQSYRKYMWKTGVNYRFLLKGQPAGNGSTDYTAYFYAPEIGKWELIASFRRPKTNTYLTRPHSFLENFHTETGNISRKGMYTNQWIYDTKGEWYEMTRAKFTADATARKESRMDYSGGAEGTSFFMRNCGFFTGWTEINSIVERKELGIKPNIDFSILP